jgi:hypothetical protein
MDEVNENNVLPICAGISITTAQLGFIPVITVAVYHKWIMQSDYRQNDLGSMSEGAGILFASTSRMATPLPFTQTYISLS